MQNSDALSFQVDSLFDMFGQTNTLSPLREFLAPQNFVRDGEDRILVDATLKGLSRSAQASAGGIHFLPESFEIAGARENIFWEPSTTKAAIVTCGGLAPGLNNVIQSIVTVLSDRYKVKNIYGVPYGYYGFSHDPETKRFRFGWRRLDSLAVQNIDNEAGSVLGSGRGNSNPQRIVDALVLRDINLLFTIGGDGTLAGAHAISEEAKSRRLPISVVGIPKTIDNDVMYVSKTFGFETAVSKASEAIRCAQTEARGAFNGIGLVKLMGRHSGALTATAAAATSDVDFVLVPEVELKLEGPEGFLACLMRKVVEKGYATIVVAEGAGQNLFEGGKVEFDASGNRKLNDIGRFLKDRIVAEFKSNGIETTLKYIDPSYMVRALSTTADDAVFCAHLGQNAVHAAMAGKTGVMVGYAQERFTHVPLSAVTREKKHLSVHDPLWLSVLASTGQPVGWG
jgi:6-phosphofructokinase 1